MAAVAAVKTAIEPLPAASVALAEARALRDVRAALGMASDPQDFLAAEGA